MSRTRKILKLGSLLLILTVFLMLRAHGQSSRDALESGFLNPPDSAKPRVWWHWMNGNITKEGIKLDLEWMKRVGIGGFQNFDAALNTPRLVDKRLVYMTPEWKDAFQYATTLADRSEERRVGKECRSRWSQDHEKKKQRQEIKLDIV